jgi:hypothetical protein
MSEKNISYREQYNLLISEINSIDKKVNNDLILLIADNRYLDMGNNLILKDIDLTKISLSAKILLFEKINDKLYGK